MLAFSSVRVLCHEVNRQIPQKLPPSEAHPQPFAPILGGSAVAPFSPITQQPDEDDVIIYECGEYWEIRIGDELHGLRFTLEAALARPRDVAAVHRKPAWLLDETGYPVKPIER